MKTAGEILHEARIQKGQSLKEIEKLTKIRVKFLQALEDNRFSLISQATTTRGFIKNYALAVDLNPESVLAVFRRDFLENEKGQIIPRGMVAPLSKSGLSWNPRMTLILIIFLILGVFFGYLGKQYFNFISLPKINILYPPEGEIVTEKEIEVTGNTDKDASVYINGEIVSLEETGEFHQKIRLIPGENEIVFEVLNRRGQKTRLVRKVNAQITD